MKFQGKQMKKFTLIITLLFLYGCQGNETANQQQIEKQITALQQMESQVIKLQKQLTNDDKDYEKMKTAVMEVVASRFRPEFINRIDDAIVFHPLAQQHIRAITEIQLQQLQARLNDRDIKLIFSDAALDNLSEAGFDPVYGARPLKRAIQELVENPLLQRRSIRGRSLSPLIFLTSFSLIPFPLSE